MSFIWDAAALKDCLPCFSLRSRLMSIIGLMLGANPAISFWSSLYRSMSACSSRGLINMLQYITAVHNVIGCVSKGKVFAKTFAVVNRKTLLLCVVSCDD